MYARERQRRILELLEDRDDAGARRRPEEDR